MRRGACSQPSDNQRAQAVVVAHFDVHMRAISRVWGTSATIDRGQHMNAKSLLFALATLLAPGLVQAIPAHYIVFELAADGQVQPVFYRQVELAQASWSSESAVAPSDLAYRIWHRGVEQGLRYVPVPGLRAEFAVDPEHGNHAVDARDTSPAVRHFVLRLPLAEADAVEFGDGSAKQHFALAELAASASRMRLAAAVPVQVSRAPDAGDPGNRVDVLVLGEGYTAAEQAKFEVDAAALAEEFFAITPYLEYQSFVNWTTGFVASNQSGADHPPYQPGCTSTSCCADPDAQPDPLSGQFVDNAFDSTFCYNQTQRLLYPDESAVLAAAAAYPDWDQLILLVNDPVYGGAGGIVAVASMNVWAADILLHEYGHSFTGLADEYGVPNPGFPLCSDVASSGLWPCEANATDVAVASAVKWRGWFNPANPIPTPAGLGYTGVGLFEGARYYASGMYRPVDERCMMNYLDMPFCPVCAQEYVRVLYRGGFGVPAGGIDLIEPGSESPSATTPVAYAAGTDRTFTVALLQPTIGVLDVQWYLDGNPITGVTTASYLFRQDLPAPTDHILELRVKDMTPLVLPGVDDGLLEHRRTWTIHVRADDVIFRDGFGETVP